MELIKETYLIWELLLYYYLNKNLFELNYYIILKLITLNIINSKFNN